MAMFRAYDQAARRHTVENVVGLCRLECEEPSIGQIPGSTYGAITWTSATGEVGQAAIWSRARFRANGSRFLRGTIESELNGRVAQFRADEFGEGDTFRREPRQRLVVALRERNLNPVRADDKIYMPDRNLWNNVCVYMLCCKQGVAVFEDRVSDEFNPNVALEYGFMRALNRRTLLLADRGFRHLRADVIGTLRETFDITDIAGTVREPVHRWCGEIGF